MPTSKAAQARYYEGNVKRTISVSNDLDAYLRGALAARISDGDRGVSMNSVITDMLASYQALNPSPRPRRARDSKTST